MTGMPSSGDQIGPYQVTAVLGFTARGGAFSAWHTGTQREVTLAVLQPGLAGDLDARRQFFAEVKDLLKVRHENLVEVLDVVDEGTSPWFAVELLRGVSLAEVVRRAGRLPLAAALHVAWQLCQGLRAAHETGLVHRALRMDSVFLVEQGGAADVVKILGFTPGSPVDIEAAWPAIAPEQWRDEFVDHRADFYALGALLYELTTGRRPIAGQTRDELRANHERASVVPPSTFSMSMPPALDALIVQCLAKDPEDRPSMILEIEAALRDVASEVPPYQQRPLGSESGNVAIPGLQGWNVVAIAPRSPTWTASSPPAPAPVALGDSADIGDGPEALDDADVADLEEAEPLATPWPARLPFLDAPVPAAASGGLAALAAAATEPPAPSTVGPDAGFFGDMDALVPGDLLKDIAAAVDGATDAPAPPPTSSVFDLFADEPLLVPSAPAAVATPALASFDLVEPAPVLDLREQATPLIPAPAVAVAPGTPLQATQEKAPEPPLPALRPAMGPRAGVIAAVPGAVVATQKEILSLASEAVVDEPAFAAAEPPPQFAPAFSPAPAPSFAASFAPELVVDDAPPARSKLPFIAAAAAVVVLVLGATVLLRGGDEPSTGPTTVAIADPAGPTTPTPAPTPEPPVPVEAAPVTDAGVAVATAAVTDAGVDAAAPVDAGSVVESADAGPAVVAVAAAIAEPAAGGDVFGFPDEPGNAPPPAPPPAAATTKSTRKPAATKPTKPAKQPTATKPAKPKPVKPVIKPKPTPKPKPAPKPPAGKDTLKDGGLVNPFKR